jgi:hypothetical protein
MGQDRKASLASAGPSSLAMPMSQAPETATHNRLLNGNCHMRTELTAVLALMLACNPAAADTCEALRLRIEAKIKDAGVARFTVTTVATGASAPGKVVGTCDQGNRKIMYDRPASDGGGARPQAAPAKAAVPASTRASNGIITECKDGTVTTRGDCRK